MTDTEHYLFAELQKAERSARRWKGLATALGVLFLLMLSLMAVSAVAFRNNEVMQQRLAAEDVRRELEEAEKAGVELPRADPAVTEREARRWETRGATEQPAEAPKRMPKADDP